LSRRLLFISDLHLEKSKPTITRGFLEFLERNQNRCSELYILGDLFEVWIGDDAISELETLVANSLAQFSQQGASIFILHGNRDFLIRQEYADRCQATLIYDHHLIQTKTDKILLLHGDTLCIDDEEYQKFRILVRNALWQKEFLSKTIDERQAFAKKARNESQKASATKTQQIMDVNENSVKHLFSETAATKILHGHTHRPAIHESKLPPSQDSSSRDVQRIVLGDWDKLGWFAEIHEEKLSLHSFKIQP
jgi:UDP-2,3-diacylglucosamine hydrolase